MKPGIHPTWYPEASVTCACGTKFVTGSTKKEIHTDVCSECHPFFTGEQRIVDTAGQVERFMKRQGAKEKIASARPVAEEAPAKKEKGRDQKPAKPVVLPAELPLAMIEDKPAPLAPAPEPPVAAEPAMTTAQPEPAAELKTVMPAPIAPAEPMPVTLPLPEPEPMVIEPVAEAPKRVTAAKRTAAAVRKAPAKKSAAKKIAVPRAKAAKPKASAAKKPAPKKPAAKKKK